MDELIKKWNNYCEYVFVWNLEHRETDDPMITFIIPKKKSFAGFMDWLAEGKRPLETAEVEAKHGNNIDDQD